MIFKIVIVLWASHLHCLKGSAWRRAQVPTNWEYNPTALYNAFMFSMQCNRKWGISEWHLINLLTAVSSLFWTETDLVSLDKSWISQKPWVNVCGGEEVPVVCKALPLWGLCSKFQVGKYWAALPLLAQLCFLLHVLREEGMSAVCQVPWWGWSVHDPALQWKNHQESLDYEFRFT